MKRGYKQGVYVAEGIDGKMERITTAAKGIVGKMERITTAAKATWRKEGGFSYWEVLITLYLLTLLLSFLYPSLLLIEQAEKGSRIYSAVLLWADEETERWRKGLPWTAQEKEIEGVQVTQTVEALGYSEGVERVSFRYEWRVGDLPYQIDMEIERGVRGAKG